jgi:hypothetical protein
LGCLREANVRIFFVKLGFEGDLQWQRVPAKVSFKRPEEFTYEVGFGTFTTGNGQMMFIDKNGGTVTYPYGRQESPFGLLMSQSGPVAQTGESSWSALALSGLEPFFLVKPPRADKVAAETWKKTGVWACHFKHGEKLDVTVFLDKKSGLPVRAKQVSQPDENLKQTEPVIVEIEFKNLVLK